MIIFTAYGNYILHFKIVGLCVLELEDLFFKCDAEPSKK